MTSGLKMICLIRIYTSYRIQRFGAGVGSNGTRLFDRLAYCFGFSTTPPTLKKK